MMLKHLLAALLLSAAFGALAQPYTVAANGQEVTDAKTGLVWRRCAEGMAASGSTCTGTASTFNHENALARASAQAAAAGVLWRLPNVKELSSIADKNKIPAIDATAFPATPSSSFWSSSPFVGVALNAWFVNFNDGDVGGNGRGYTFHVRLVRAGQ